MALVTTIIESGTGRSRKRLVFKHVGGGVAYGPFVEYRPNDEDENVFCAAHATSLEASLVEMELTLNINRAGNGSFAAPTFMFCTAGQYRTRLREWFRDLSGLDVCRAAWYIRQLGLTDNQLKNMFGINDAQLVALKAKLTSWEAKYNDIQAQVGE